jgi:hypothetical protein
LDLLTQLTTTSNYSAIANLHYSQIIISPAKPFFSAYFIFNSLSLATTSNSGDSSASRAQVHPVLTPEDHSLWKATKKFKRPTIAIPPLRTPDRTWARTDHEKVNIFAEHLATVFSPVEDDNIDRSEILNLLHAPFQLPLPVRLFSPIKV